jgi:hypothetical protein
VGRKSLPNVTEAICQKAFGKRLRRTDYSNSSVENIELSCAGSSDKAPLHNRETSVTRKLDAFR